jgi:hypothetical protein
MIKTTHRRLLNVIDLAKRLAPEDRAILSKDFPEFDIDSLLEEAATLGDPAEPSSSDTRRLREIKFQIEIARRAIGRIIPEFEKTWRGVGARLGRAATTEFYAGILALLGGGGAAGGALLSHYVSASIAAGIAFFASALSLHSQFQRRSLRDDVSLSSVYAMLSGRREILLQLQDALSLWTAESSEVLLGNERSLYETTTRALEETAKVDDAVSSVAPLLRYDLLGVFRTG